MRRGGWVLPCATNGRPHLAGLPAVAQRRHLGPGECGPLPQSLMQPKPHSAGNGSVGHIREAIWCRNICSGLAYLQLHDCHDCPSQGVFARQARSVMLFYAALFAARDIAEGEELCYDYGMGRLPHFYVSVARGVPECIIDLGLRPPGRPPW